MYTLRGFAHVSYLAATLLACSAHAQNAVVSPEVSPDHSITFRVLAPGAKTVALQAGDIPKASRDVTVFTKDEQGVWTAISGPVEPGAYRYTFLIDGVPTVDPHNPAVSESNSMSWSVVPVAGSDLMDTRNVPHGSVESVHYYSSALARDRRMHVYTPPGYGTGTAKYPVFYLLHGASDSDDAWTSIGRAGFILDNLIAAKKAQPMIVVMPAGHTSTSNVRGPRDEFLDDFEKDIMPHVEKNYRVLTDRSHVAIAGLSMGGSQTLNISMSHLDKFGYVGVFSSGVLGARRGAGPPVAPANWEETHAAMLDNPGLKPGLKTLWFATGVEDALMPNTKATVEMLKKHGFAPVLKETPGGHTWLNWRDYLIEFAPMLFR